MSNKEIKTENTGIVSEEGIPIDIEESTGVFPKGHRQFQQLLSMGMEHQEALAVVAKTIQSQNDFEPLLTNQSIVLTELSTGERVIAYRRDIGEIDAQEMYNNAMFKVLAEKAGKSVEEFKADILAKVKPNVVEGTHRDYEGESFSQVGLTMSETDTPVNVILSKDTHTPVRVSELEEYGFYCPASEEHLFKKQTYANVSYTAMQEGRQLVKDGIPENYSNDKQLEEFVRAYLDTGRFVLADFKKLDALSGRVLEFDESVLMAILYF